MARETGLDFIVNSKLGVMDRRQAKKMGMDHAGDLGEAFRLVDRLLDRPTVLVVPAGGTLLPRLTA